jgi:hypothetical protein
MLHGVKIFKKLRECWKHNLGTVNISEPGQRSRYSDWLRAGRLRGWSSSPGRVKNFLFSKSSRPALGSTQPPIQWVPGALSAAVKRPGREANHLPPASAEVKKMWIYRSTPHTPLWRSANSLSTGTTLRFTVNIYSSANMAAVDWQVVGYSLS